MVVRLRFLEGLSGAPEEQVCLPRGRPFQRLQQARWQDFRPQQHVDMVGHDRVSAEIVMARTPHREDAATMLAIGR